MLQCVIDVRRTVDFVISHPEFDSSRIGIAGTSLGAIVTALVTGIDNRIHSAAYILGGVDLARVLWRSSRVVTEREDLRNKGYTEEKLRVALAPIEPLNYLKTLRPSRTFVVGAKYDTVIPPDAAEKLIEVLDKPHVLWLDTGHYGGFFVQKRVHREVAQFFSAAFENKAYVPPKRIEAPTIRLGVSLYPERGLQVAAGIDFWKGDKAGDTFASLQFAPRGIQIFLGRRLDRGLALGVFARSGGIAPGFFWSIVL
jgi:dienelactone hydrolase